jgi:hypothetical protein
MTEPTDTTTTQAADTTTGLSDEPIPGDTASSGWAEGQTEQAAGNQWLTQLQKMIDDIATQAAPVARQIGAKAAELAAVAAEKAGPALHRAADVTTDVGQKVAERAQKLATDLRQQADADAPATTGSTNGHGAAAATHEETTGTGSTPA